MKGGVEEKCQRKVRVSEGVRIFQMEGRGEGQSGTPEGRRPGGRRGDLAVVADLRQGAGG